MLDSCAWSPGKSFIHLGVLGEKGPSNSWNDGLHEECSSTARWRRWWGHDPCSAVLLTQEMCFPSTLHQPNRVAELPRPGSSFWGLLAGCSPSCLLCCHAPLGAGAQPCLCCSGLLTGNFLLIFLNMKNYGSKEPTALFCSQSTQLCLSFCFHLKAALSLVWLENESLKVPCLHISAFLVFLHVFEEQSMFPSCQSTVSTMQPVLVWDKILILSPGVL